jgi:hypothetical protein
VGELEADDGAEERPRDEAGGYHGLALPPISARTRIAGGSRYDPRLPLD